MRIRRWARCEDVGDEEERRKKKEEEEKEEEEVRGKEG